MAKLYECRECLQQFTKKEIDWEASDENMKITTVMTVQGF